MEQEQRAFNVRLVGMPDWGSDLIRANSGIAQHMAAMLAKVDSISEQFEPTRPGSLAHTVRQLVSGRIKEAALPCLIGAHTLANTPPERLLVLTILDKEFKGDIDRLASTSATDLQSKLQQGYKEASTKFQVAPMANITAFLTDVSNLKRWLSEKVAG